jgi:hypothetical protein
MRMGIQNAKCLRWKRNEHCRDTFLTHFHFSCSGWNMHTVLTHPLWNMEHSPQWRAFHAKYITRNNSAKCCSGKWAALYRTTCYTSGECLDKLYEWMSFWPIFSNGILSGVKNGKYQSARCSSLINTHAQNQSERYSGSENKSSFACRYSNPVKTDKLHCHLSWILLMLFCIVISWDLCTYVLHSSWGGDMNSVTAHHIRHNINNNEKVIVWQYDKIR